MDDDTLPAPDAKRSKGAAAAPPEAAGDAATLPAAVGDAATLREAAGDAATLPAAVGVAIGGEGVAVLGREAPGRYAFHGEIGRGGLGRVLVARDQQIGRDVAVKELLPSGELGRGSGRPYGEADQRFLREARVTGQLEHPSIVPVYEIGERTDGALYYTMRRVQGVPLSAAIEQADGLRQRLKLLPRFRDVCQAIAYAHSRGVIHRDIKPDNVMLGDFGETVVLDWGLAKVAGHDDEERAELSAGLSRLREEGGARTIAGVAMGTPYYMPPEQALGKLNEVDSRSDIYALGAVLYEILTGKPPFDGDSAMQILSNVLAETLVPVRTHSPDAPAELAAIAEKALRKEKAARYESAAALARDIEAFMSGDRVMAYEYRTAELVRLFARRHRAAVIAGAVVLLALVGSVVAVSVSYAREHAARLRESAARDDAVSARERLERALSVESRERRRAAFHSAFAQTEKARAFVKEHRLPEARILAAAALVNNPAQQNSPLFDPKFVEEHPSALDLRARSASVLSRAASTPSLRLVGVVRANSDQEPLAVTEKVSGHFAVADASGRVSLIALEPPHGKRELAVGSGPVVAGEFSSDGTELVVLAASGELRVHDVATGALRRTTQVDGARDLRCSPDGKTLAVALGDGRLEIRDPASGQLKRSIPLPSTIFAMSWSPDSRSLAVVLTNKDVVIVEAATGARRPLRATPRGWHAAEFSPDGRTLVLADWEKSIILFDVEALAPLAELSAHTAAVYSFGHSRDGKYLLSGGFDRRLVVWDLETRAPLVALTAHDERIRRILHQVSRDRFITLSWDRSVKVWEITEAPRARAGRGHGDVIRAIALAPDGRRLATGSADQTARIWDTESLSPQQLLKAHSGSVLAIAWSPDGGRVATGSADRSVILWDGATGEKIRRLTGHGREVTAVGFVAGGAQLASADASGEAHLWNTEDGTLARAIPAHAGSCWGLAVSPDGKSFATAGKDKKVRLFGADGSPRGTLSHHDWVSGVAFSPDGDRLATSGKDALVSIWDVRTQRVTTTIRGHESWVNRVVFSRDGRRLVTSSDDRSLRLWDAASGEPLLVFDADEAAEAMALPAADRLVFADGPILRAVPFRLSTLDADPTVLLEEAERSVGLSLDGLVLETAPP